MDGITEEIEEAVGSKKYLDYDTYYIGSENTLFRDEDSVTPVSRTKGPDEDDLAVLVEFQLNIKDLTDQIENTSKQATKISKRLELARNDEAQRLPRERYMKGLNMLTDLIGSKKIGKQGKLQQLVAQRAELLLDRNEHVSRDYGSLWAGWYQIEDPEQWLADYLEKPMIAHWDPDKFDNQDHLTNEADEIECLGDEHCFEMINGEGLVWMDQKPVKENPYLPRDWYDWGKARKMEEKALEIQSLVDSR